MVGFTPRTYTDTWAFAADLSTFGFSYPSTKSLAGVFWTQTQQIDYTIVNLHPGTPAPSPTGVVANLQNTYSGMDVNWDYGIGSIHYFGPFSTKWVPIPYCDPTPFPETYGLIPHMTSVLTSTGSVVILGTKRDGSIDEIGRSFGATAQTVLGQVAAGSREILVADDRFGGSPRGEAGSNAIIVETGKTRIRGSMSLSGGVIDAVLGTAPAEQSTAALRSYSGKTGKLYSLEFAAGSWSIKSRSVAAALAGTTTLTSFTVSTALTNPVAITYSRANGLIYVVDVLVSGRFYQERLLTVNPTSGASSILWTSGAFGSPATPTVTLSSTTDGELFIATSDIGDGMGYVLHVDGKGRPWHSTSFSGSLHGRVVGTSAGFTIPIAQTFTDTTPNASFVKKTWSTTTAGACGSTWLSTYFGRTASGASGSLLDGMVCW